MTMIRFRGRQFLTFVFVLGAAAAIIFGAMVYKRNRQLSILTTSRFPWTNNDYYASTAKGTTQDKPMNSSHPILHLIKEGHEKLARLQAARSHTVEEAAGRYRERRGRHPPPGFEDWFKAAKKRDAIVIEDFFDRIHHDISPFWALDQLELRRRAHGQPELIRIRNGKVNLVSDDLKRGNRWMQIWTKLVKEIGHLPDLDIPINVMDETRVLVPWEKINEYIEKERRTRHIFPASEAVATYTGYADVDSHPGQYDPHWIGGEAHKYWDHVRAACPPDSESRNASSLPSFNSSIKDIYPTGPIEAYTYKGFVRNFTASKDACLQPHLRGLHATFVESISMSTTHELMPIFGGSKLPQNNEILIPGAVYLANDKRYSGGKGIGGPWGDKMGGLVWRGVASGGRNKEDNWWHFHRHRWVQMMNGTTMQKVLAGDETAAPTFALLTPKVYNVSAQRNGFLGSWLAVHADVGAVDLLCFPGEMASKNKRLPTCSYSSPFFDLVKSKSMTQQYKYKYLPDIDGNSFSGRWRGFLRSTSCPLKATVYTEWHDDRLVPWVHFVPFDNTFMDIYAIMEFFLEGHDAQGKRIADEGSRWASQVVRRDDMLLYMWRLLLEYARVVDPQRDRLAFIGDLAAYGLRIHPAADPRQPGQPDTDLHSVHVWAFDDDDPTHDIELHWSDAVRAIRARAYVHDPYVTGVGFVAQNHIRADADEDKSWKHPEAELVPNDLYNRDLQQQYGCFAVHDFCWQLLRHVVDPKKEIPTKTIARQLFAILYNTPVWGSELIPGHDYGGALRARVYGRYTDNIVASIAGSDLFWILQDPDNEFDFGAEITTDLPANTPYMDLHGPKSRETDVFSRLPNEVIMLVVANLPSKSVCDLRLASKHVAAYTPPSLLSQSFWASRFDHGAEMAFAFALRETRLPPKPIDWRQLYHAARSMLTGFETYPGFRNRRRIWECLQHIMPILALRLQNIDKIATSPYLGRPLKIPEGFAPLGSVSSNVTFEFEKPHPSTPGISPKFVAGSRLFEKQYLGIPSSAHGQPLRLGVSFISLVDQNYICGLRFLTSRGTGQGSELSRAGFINPKNEKTVEIDSLEDVDAVSFHITISGIIGLSFQTRIMNMPRSQTIGQFGDCVEDNGVSQLKADRKLQDIGFVIGLDACKIVSLEIVGRETATEPLPSKEIEQITEVWTPAPPKCPVKWQHIYPSTQQTFNLCSAMDFGSQDGRLLGLLTQVNVFMGSWVNVFLGMSFVYADGTERVYGRKDNFLPSGDKTHCFVQSFTIAGPEGERICQADTAYLPSHDTIQRLSFSTTANRSIDFCLYGDGLPTGELVETSRRASPGKVFTSFFSLHSSPNGHFRDFSALEISAGQDNNDWSAGNIAIRKYPGDMILTSVYDSIEHILCLGSQAFTSASLSGLRRIRVSVGDAGYTREPHHISGLKLEYEGSSIMVGQWISEHASMEIGEDERLVEVEVFHQADNDCEQMKHGPMSGIHITTSKGATMKVMHQPTEGDVRLCFRETPYERLDTIQWSCSRSWDHVRVTSHCQTDMVGRHLYFSPESAPRPMWAVPEQVFLQEKTADGGDDPLKSIMMTFKSMSREAAALIFMYRSGRLLCLGDRTADGNPVLVTLNDGEQLTRMDIGIVGDNQIATIQFKTDQMRKLNLTYPSRHPIQIERWHVCTLIHDNSNGKREDGGELGGDDLKGDDLDGVHVGFWAIPRRLDSRALQYPLFGPLFERSERAVLRTTLPLNIRPSSPLNSSLN